MLAIAAFGGDDVQIMQLGFANGATGTSKGPNIIEILEHDFDNSITFVLVALGNTHTVSTPR